MKVILVIVFIFALTKKSETLINFPVTKSFGPLIVNTGFEMKSIEKLQETIPDSKIINNRRIRSTGSKLKLVRQTQGTIVFPSARPSVVAVQKTKPMLPVTTKVGDNLECLIQSGMIIFQGKCQELLSSEPCGSGKWLVVNKNGIPECGVKMCSAGKLFYKDKCIDIDSFPPCGISEMLYVEFTGEVYCDCEPDFIFNNDKCEEEHTRGSCPFGEYLEVTSDKQIMCVKNPCKRDDVVFNPANKQCYTKSFEGKCSSDKGLGILYQKDGTAICAAIDNRRIFEVPVLRSCPAGSKRNYRNECQRQFLRNNPLDYRMQSQHTLRYTRCPPNYKLYPNGDCRKPNSRLG